MSLILNYPNNMLTPPVPLEGTVTPPTPEQGEVSRVPTQALPTVVPPQKPDKHPDEMQMSQPQGEYCYVCLFPQASSPIEHPHKITVRLTSKPDYLKDALSCFSGAYNVHSMIWSPFQILLCVCIMGISDMTTRFSAIQKILWSGQARQGC